MRSTPLVSIVIDNYNYGRFLVDAVRSALEQSYNSTEVIVVDDGSTDDSRDILLGFGRDIRTIFKTNGGQASAFNAGVEVSQGEIVCLLDSDDMWDSGKVAQVVEVTSCPSSAGWALLRHNMRVASCQSTAQGLSASVVPGIRASAVERIRADDVLIRRRNAPTSALAFPKRLWNRCGPVAPESAFIISADAYLYTHLPRFGTVISVASELGTYRVHGSNNYVAPTSSEKQLRAQMQLEFSLLRTLPRTARLHNTLLALAHSTAGRQAGYLSELGSLQQRLQRIVGARRIEVLRPDVTKTVCRELLRSLSW